MRLSKLVIFSALLLLSCNSKKDAALPNVILIYLDDSGYSDFEPFENAAHITPNVKKLASEGTAFTNFHVPQAICSASRAALLSGCVPGRTGVFSAHAPGGRGLEPGFAIIPELLKETGYVTGFYGKWHIGDQEDTRPHVRGFDESAGLMYSNDMWKHHPEDPDFWGKYPIQYWENGKVIDPDVDSADQKNLTKLSTGYSVDFIDRHHDEPFFLYLAYSMPHVPLFVSDEFLGKSGKGLYADVIMEIDHGIGKLMEELKKHDIDQNTMIIFSSDNGPWTVYGNHAGFTPFREAKGTSFDGGLRSALIIKYLPLVAAGVTSDAFFSTIDILPTICELSGTPLPNTIIDGESIVPILEGKDFSFTRDYLPFSNGRNFEGIFSKDGRWKLHLPHKYRVVTFFGQDGQPGKYHTDSISLSLFDMENDPMETKDVKVDFPQVLDELLSLAEKHMDSFYK